VVNNTADVGGGLYLAGNGSFVSNSTIAHNYAALAGGGIACASNVTLSGVIGLGSNVVGSSSGSGTVMASCVTVTCNIFTSNMPSVFAACSVGNVSYVSPNGTDFSQCGGQSLPCATVPYAMHFASGTPIVVQLTPGTFGGGNCLIAGPFPRALELRGDSAGGSVLACSSASGTVLSLTSNETPNSTWIHDLTIQLGSASTVHIVNSSPRLSSVLITSPAVLPPLSTPLVLFRNSSAVSEDVAVSGISVAAGSTSPLVQIDCSLQSCSSTVTLTSFALTGNTGTVSLLIAGGTTVLMTNASVLDNSAVGYFSLTNDVAPVTCAGGASLISHNSVWAGNTGVFGGALASDGCTISLVGAQFFNNSAQQSGGAICARNGLIIATQSLFANNSAGVSGGAIASLTGSCVIGCDSVTFAANSAPNGGAISVAGGHLSVTNAIIQANRASIGGALNVNGLTASLIASNTTLSSNTAATGPAAFVSNGGQLVLSGGSVVELHVGTADGALDIGASGSFLCIDSSIHSNSAAGVGAAIVASSANLTLLRCTVMANNAGIAGGALFASQSTVTMMSGLIGSCYAQFGGGMYLIESDLSVTDVTIGNNSALSAGGALVLVNSQAHLTDTLLSNSTAPDGGALFSVVSDIWLSRAALASNTAMGNGGALSVILGSLVANNSALTGNRGDNGGAIAAQSLSSLQFTNCTFDLNSAKTGGALNVEDQRGPLQLQSCAFVHNTASSVGGAILVGSSSVALSASDTIWTNNSASQGAAIASNADLSLVGCMLRCNMAAADGGTMWAAPNSQSQYIRSNLTGTRCEANVGGCVVQESGSLFITQSFFGFNVNSAGSGGALHVTNCAVHVTNSSVIANSAQQGGAVYASQSTTVVIVDTFVVGNTATGDGGAVNLDVDATLNVTSASGLCLLANNSAVNGGGGFAFAASSSSSALSISPYCAYLNNSALYGQNLATGTSFSRCFSRPFTNRHCAAEVAVQLSSPGSVNAESAVPLQSSVIVQLVDAYGQVIVVPSANERVFVVSNNGSTSVQGSSFATVVNGTAVFGPGQFSVAGTPGSTVQVNLVAGLLQAALLTVHISLCVPGFELALSGSVPVCSPCPAGMFKSEVGNSACQQCPAGTFKSSPGNATCTPCSSGFYAPSAGLSQCIAVPPNSISVGNGTTVLECPTLGVSCGGGLVISEPNYFSVWYNSSVNALLCPAGACAGGVIRNTSSDTATYSCTTPSAETEAAGLVSTYCAWNNACANNRTGYMCGACEADTAYSSSGNCVGAILLPFCVCWSEADTDCEFQHALVWCRGASLVRLPSTGSWLCLCTWYCRAARVVSSKCWSNTGSWHFC
jgi:predicted outer membrane repeat protein